MTIQTIQSGKEFSSAAGRSSPTFESFLVVGANGGQHTVQRQSTAVTASARPCVILHVTPVDEGQLRAGFDEFDALTAELAHESKTDPRLSEVLKKGRAWVAETFYDSEPTLASLRLAAGLSQRELGEITHLHQPHVSRYESGKSEPLVSTAEALASALGVSLEVFARALKNTRLRAAEQESKS